jgi:hypothetical protein
MRLKTKDIPGLRQLIQISQDHKCMLCSVDLTTPGITPCLDHDHTTGRIRGILCRWCNRAEGKINNLAKGAKRNLTHMTWLRALLDYWTTHAYCPREEFHPTWKTTEERRIERNAKARNRRKSKKK